MRPDSCSRSAHASGPGEPATIAGTWPGFRGERGDNLAINPGGLARSWPKTGPNKIWEIELGEGYTGPAVWNGRVYLLDYDQANGSDALRCLSLADGRDIWRFTYPVRVKRNHGMSRTVPAVDGQHVVGFGPKCHVVCLDAVSGEFRWGIDLVKEYGTEVPQWYAGQCPLLDGDRVILAPGGDALVIAVELASGKVIWKSPNPRDWKMTHVSLVPITFAGRQQYVYCGSGGWARFGLGPFLKAGNLIFALNDDGWLTMAEACPSGYRPLAKARVLSGHEAWAPMALVAGRLLARDLIRMICLDLRTP